MDIGVGATEIAQCPLNPISARLQEEPLVSGTPAGGGHSKPHFERHVESRDASGELNPTEVVEGIPARSSRRVGLGISSVARGRSPKAQRPAISAMNSLS